MNSFIKLVNAYRLQINCIWVTKCDPIKLGSFFFLNRSKKYGAISYDAEAPAYLRHIISLSWVMSHTLISGKERINDYVRHAVLCKSVLYLFQDLPMMFRNTAVVVLEGFCPSLCSQAGRPHKRDRIIHIYQTRCYFSFIRSTWVEH